MSILSFPQNISLIIVARGFHHLRDEYVHSSSASTSLHPLGTVCVCVHMCACVFVCMHECGYSMKAEADLAVMPHVIIRIVFKTVSSPVALKLTE